MEVEPQPRESAFLQSALNNESTSDFMRQTWQLEPAVYRYSNAADNRGDGSWNDTQMQQSPREEFVRQGWHVLTNLLKQAELRANLTNQGADDHNTPLLFQSGSPKTPEEVDASYGTSVFAAYLDGCSVVQNHGDLVSPWIAALCEDLQKTFPHVYANCYLTPPNSQTVPVHADDRDVFVLQVVGSKNWKVYEKVPIPYPYPHEQVGKGGLEVPQAVVDGPMRVSTTLNPGDILYMPRGFVHQASCSDSLSFHVTFALATHDWSLAGMMSMGVQNVLTRAVECRKSILPRGDTNKDELQAQIDAAIQAIKEEVTAETILNNLGDRLEKHNHRASPERMKLIHSARFPSASQNQGGQLPVGKEAAKGVTLETALRAATAEERAKVTPEQSSTQARGLNVREDIADDIMGIIGQLKTVPNLQCRVADLRSLLQAPNAMVCDLALLSLAKRAVELGAFAVVQ